MISLKGECFNSLYLRALKIAIFTPRIYEDSRVGPVINLGQAYFEIEANDPRLIFLNHRKLNPVFAVIEGAWILSGSNKLGPLINELPIFNSYSDDGKTLNGAYGSRLRHFFGLDQIKLAVQTLKASPFSRRVVLTMYSPKDIISDSLDIPCNTSIYLKVKNDALDITVLNRSNDLYLGLPYNVFVFGLLQRYLASELGLPVGIQRHFSDSLHIYQNNIENAECIVRDNNREAACVISSQFDWGFADDILSSIEEIVSGDYAAVHNKQLAAFLQHFCKANRKRHETKPRAFKFSDDFYGFLAYQWLVSICNNTSSGKTWETQRSLMMSNGIKQKIEQLGAVSGKEMAPYIADMAQRLKGKLVQLKEVVNNKMGPFELREYGSNEDLALRVILLSAVWTTLDPFLANTPIGIRAKQEIKIAAELLDVPFSNIGALSTVEDELFSALSKLLD